MYFVLVVFNLRLFNPTHLVNSGIKMLILFSISSTVLPVTIMLASSAYNTKCAIGKMLGKSFIKIKNRSGPNMLPCGTPWLHGINYQY